MIDIAIIVGHTPDSPGVKSITGVHEFPFNDALAASVLRVLQRIAPAVCARVVYRARPNDYEGLPAKVNATGAKLAVELHFNGVEDERAHGTEMLYWHSSSVGKRFASLLQMNVRAALGTRDRGVKAIRSEKERGGLLLLQTAMPCVIAEPGFGTNAADWQRLSTRRDQLADAYARAIKSMLEEM